ncbi:hypothetical protein MMC28_002763 [Mycoblastus sanguinarius]|nr:hypothetical protein [Mycoblastus sanguinarius]
MSQELSTPRNHPIYGVNIGDEAIRALSAFVFPDLNLTHVERLGFSKSYNNRLYFLDFKPKGSRALTGETATQCVLKIVGRPFDQRKIENEVGCLLLLNCYCSDHPVPDVFAWSRNGEEVDTIDGKSTRFTSSDTFSRHGWILMSRLLGNPLETADLDSVHGASILRQLAKYIAIWKETIPITSSYGNVRLQSSSESLCQPADNTFKHIIPGLEVSIQGCLLFLPATTRACTSYSHALAQDQLTRLRSDSIYVPLSQRIEPDIDNFVLANPPSQIPHENVFSWLDFAPRNILVTPSGNVTGLIDFEFSGFFPESEEFVNAVVRQNDDWQLRHWEGLMRELQFRGVKIPPPSDLELGGKGSALGREQRERREVNGFEEGEWRYTCAWAKVVDSLAPWELRDMEPGEEMTVRVLEAVKEVKDGVSVMRKLKGRTD